MSGLRILQNWRCGILAILCAGAILAGCDHRAQLSIAPNVFVNADYYPAEDVPERLRQAVPTIYYVTDRQPEAGAGAQVRYGFQRSDSMAFGAAQVSFGDIATWQDLVRQSRGETGGALPALRVRRVEELVRFSATPLPFSKRNGRLTVLPDAAAAYSAQMAKFRAVMAREVSASAKGEVLVYVHGFNNRFDDGLATMANLWHYTGRRGVPVAYSWPSGNRGLTGYFKDTESGEFSIFHFKEFIRGLATVPGVRKIKIVAHSRGTDVVSSALREMIIFERGAGRDPHRALKLGTLIMAAPDLDLGVVRQRLVAEHFAGAFDQIDVYVNPGDGALGLAQLIGAGTRFGQITADDFTPQVLDSLQRAGNVHFINVENSGGRLGHSYFRENTGVVSDIILTLRTGDFPGTARRPLERIVANFWTVHPNYPFARKKPREPDQIGQD